MSHKRPGEDGDFFTAAALQALPEFFERGGAEDWLFRQVWPDDVLLCPYCADKLTERAFRSLGQFGKATCRRCKKQFRALSESPFMGVRLSPAQIVTMAALFEAGARNETIARLIAVDPSTVCLWRRRLSGLTLASVADKSVKNGAPDDV